MIGLGKWKARVDHMFFKGDVILEIKDKDGEYDFDIELNADMELPISASMISLKKEIPSRVRAKFHFFPAKRSKLSLSSKATRCPAILKLPL